jgi:hypothetical protein
MGHSLFVMRKLAVTLAVRLALCFALTWYAWRELGAGGLLAGGVMIALALPRPLLKLASELRHLLRERIWHDLEGRHYAYRGHRVQVLEDVSHCRWVLASDVRAIVGTTASDGALSLTYPSGFRRVGEPAQPHFSDEALLVHLTKVSGPNATRFRRWVEREIAFPARRRRKRLGIRLDAPDYREGI